MAYLSKNPIPKLTRERIENELVSLLFSVNSKSGRTLFSEVLTKTELLMLAKRVTTILMLIDEQSYYRIQQVLGVSSSTSKRLHRLLMEGVFESLEKYVAQRKNREDLSRKISLIIRGGLPPKTYVIKKRR